MIKSAFSMATNTLLVTWNGQCKYKNRINKYHNTITISWNKLNPKAAKTKYALYQQILRGKRI